MKNKMVDLRNHLFETLEALKDAEKPMEIERARTIASVAQVLVNSAKIEVDYMKVSGSKGSGFIPEHAALPASGEPALRVHRLK